MISIDDSTEWIFDHCLPRDLSHNFIQRRAGVVSVLALKADRVLDQFGRFPVERCLEDVAFQSIKSWSEMSTVIPPN